MMNAIKNFMKKPITWGDSFKWSGISLGLYAAVIGTIVAYDKWITYLGYFSGYGVRRTSYCK